MKQIVKIVIVGDGGVGKTALLFRYIDDIFVEDTQMTIGTNFFIKRVKFPERNITILLQIWDIGGQEMFSVVRPNFYRGAKGIIYAFDLTRKYTYLNLIKWKNEVEEVIGVKPNILVGTKSDLIEKEKTNDKLYYGNSLKGELKAHAYFETSAKDNVEIDVAFQKLALEIYNYEESEKLSIHG